MDTFTVLHALNQAIITAGGGEASSWKLFVEVFTGVVTFGVVILILKMYAFGPILQVIDERRDKIAGDLKRAEDLQKEAEKERDELNTRLANIETEAREKMQELITEGRKIAASIHEKAEKDAAEVLEKAQQSIKHETDKARVQLKEDVIAMTMAATEKLIHEKLDSEKHKSLIEGFLSELERN